MSDSEMPQSSASETGEGGSPAAGEMDGEGNFSGDFSSGNLSPSSRSLAARRLRMAAENDVQFLSNRISKLKLEEQKALKEIEKTMEKTHEIMKNRRTYETHTVDRMQVSEEVSTSKKEERVLVSLNKDKQLKAIWVARQKLLNEKKESCGNIRKQKEINECRIHITKEEEREKNTKRREDIRKQLVYAKMVREREQKAKQEMVRKQYEEKIILEERERERKEKLASQLVIQEAQLIYRLKQLHAEKQKATRELAKAVDIINPDEIEEDINEYKSDENPEEVQEDIAAP